jgi:ureidoacrylate peracid hydrolase
VLFRRRLASRRVRRRLSYSRGINRVAAACRAAGILVVHVSHVLRADGSNTGVLGEISPIVRQGFISAGSPSAALHPDLVVDARDVLVEKPRFGAFHATDLELILRARGVDSIIITGIATERLLRHHRTRGLRARFPGIFSE